MSNDMLLSRLMITNKIKQLTKHQKLAFAIITCERILHYYVSFSVATQWGRPAFFRDAIDIAWDKLNDKKIDINIQDDLDEIDFYIPRSDDFQNSVTSAQNAAIAVHYLLELVQDNKTEHALNIAYCSIDTIYQMVALEKIINDLANVHIPKDPIEYKRYIEKQEALIDGSLLMQHEYQQQISDIDLVKASDLEDNRIVLNLRNERRTQYTGYIEYYI